jgi:hypothetical protein
LPAQTIDGIIDATMPEEMGRHPPTERSRNEGPNPEPPEKNGAPRMSVLSWGLVAWAALIAGAALAASKSTSLWWLVLVFGLLVPAISGLQAVWSANRGARPAIGPQDQEAGLLGALGELGELTATTAAMRTSLTVEEAAGMLEKLSRKGHSRPGPREPSCSTGCGRPTAAGRMRSKPRRSPRLRTTARKQAPRP